MQYEKTLTTALAACALAASSTFALADAGHKETVKFGQPGEDHHVTRTIEVLMGEMYFEPEAVDVKPGETVRFVIINEGEAVHEFNIGSEETWESHVAEMERMMDEGMIEYDRIDHDKMRRMGMMHSDANAVLLEPGERAEIVWKLPEDATEIGFACNVPGHRESGMIGTVKFKGES